MRLRPAENLGPNPLRPKAGPFHECRAPRRENATAPTSSIPVPNTIGTGPSLRGVLGFRGAVGLGATLHRIVTGKPIVTDMNKNVSIHAVGNLGKRVEELEAPTMEGQPICFIRLIQDACNPDPKKRPADMRELRERLPTAHTILLSRNGHSAEAETKTA